MSYIYKLLSNPRAIIPLLATFKPHLHLINSLLADHVHAGPLQVIASSSQIFQKPKSDHTCPCLFQPSMLPLGAPQVVPAVLSHLCSHCSQLHSMLHPYWVFAATWQVLTILPLASWPLLIPFLYLAPPYLSNSHTFFRHFPPLFFFKLRSNWDIILLVSSVQQWFGIVYIAKWLPH